MNIDATLLLITLSINLILLMIFRLNKHFAGTFIKKDALTWNYALESLTDPVVLTDLNDNLVHANSAFYMLIGKTPEKAKRQKVHHLLHQHDSHKDCEACKHRIEKREGTITREFGSANDPISYPADIVIRTIKNEKGIVIGVLQSFHNISHIKNAEKALRTSERKLAEAQRIASVGNWEWNITEDRFDWSDEIWRIFGKPTIENEKSGYVNFLRLTHPEDKEKVKAAIQAAIQNKQHRFWVDHRIVLPNGEIRYVQHQGKLKYSDEQDCLSLTGVTQDITRQKKIEEALQKEKEKAQVTLQSIGDAVLTMDVNGIIDYANPVAEELLMMTHEQIIGNHHKQVLHLVDEQTLKPIDDPINTSMNRKHDIFHEQILLLRPDGTQYSISITAAPIIVEGSIVTGVTLVLHDITEMRSLAKKLTYQASHDELTGLVNRREFEKRLNQAIESAQEHNKTHGLIYMDLDQFKIVNDTCGHTAGDELLKQVSALLAGRIRNVDTLARLGGDEFAVLLSACPPVVARNIAESLRKAIEDFRFPWQDQVFKIGASIGLITISADSGSQTEILKKADTACYVAKDAGRNRVYIYDNDTRSLDLHHGEMQWAQKINQALENNQLELFCQTIKSNNAAFRETHFEVLLRMLDSDGNYIKPESFIPAAERYQLMPAIDRWVITNTLDCLRENRANLEWENFVCSINLSGQSICDNNLLEFITQKLDETDIKPTNICFEITETTAIANLSDAGRFINVLRDMGIRFSLDDFGSGLSSFDYLKNLAIDYIKIDGSFIRDIINDNVDHAMVKSINEIGHLMGVETIAEFVENIEILKLLKKLEIDYSQGNYIGCPMPLKHYLHLNARKVAC